MRRTTMALVFLAGLAIGHSARGAIGAVQHKDTHADSFLKKSGLLP
jgi:hypothetical protein